MANCLVSLRWEKIWRKDVVKQIASKIRSDMNWEDVFGMRKRVEKIDILDELDKVIGNRSGTANSDINVLAINVPTPYYVLVNARSEIVRLRELING